MPCSQRPHSRSRFVTAVVATALLVLLFMGISGLMWKSDGSYQVVIEGRIVDAESGDPIPNVLVVAAQEKEWLAGPWLLEESRVAQTRGSPVGFGHGSSRSDRSGEFEVVVSLGIAVREPILESVLGPHEPPEFGGLEFLAFELPGGRLVVQAPIRGVWTWDGERWPVSARIQIGTVKLER